MIIKTLDDVEMFVKKASIEELKKSLLNSLNNSNPKTKEDLIFLLKSFISMIDR